MSATYQCRFCGSANCHPVVDLGMSPPSESFRTAAELGGPETFYPLDVFVCAECWLVQIKAYVAPEEIFTEYAYFSSYSTSWLKHAETFVENAIARFGLDGRSLIVELASNDGYLLQHAHRRGIPVLGVEPAANVAKVAVDQGIPTLVRFFGVPLAREMAATRRADLIVGNNVLAQVPDINDFVGGMPVLLAPNGVVSIEVPHLLRLIEENQFDTIYHEHYSYFSLAAMEAIFGRHGLEVFDVERLRSHGGSIRVFAQHRGAGRAPTAGLLEVREEERRVGVATLGYYQAFAGRVEATKRKLLRYLIDAKDRGLRVAGYGAPGKGNTLLNYCGIRTDLLEYTVDRNPYKHGRFLPGTHIPVYPVERLAETKPDVILILPWNLEREIVTQLQYARDWGAQAVVPIPEVRPAW